MKTKILILIIVLLPFIGSSQSFVEWWNVQQESGIVPSYEDDGGIGTGTDASVAVPYPTTVNADDILIVHVMDADNDSFDVPSGWTKIGENTTNTNLSNAWYWKRAVGTETGTETFTSNLTAGQLVAGIMYRFSGCVDTGTPYENSTTGAIGRGTGTGASHITTSTYVLQVNFWVIEDNPTATLSGTDWVENSNKATTVGGDATFTCASVDVPSITTPALGTYDWSSTEYYSLVRFDLLSK